MKNSQMYFISAIKEAECLKKFEYNVDVKPVDNVHIFRGTCCKYCLHEEEDNIRWCDNPNCRCHQ